MLFEGKVKYLRQQGKGKRPDAASALTAKEEILWTAATLGDFCTVQESVFLRQCGGKKLRAGNDERQSIIHGRPPATQ